MLTKAQQFDQKKPPLVKANPMLKMLQRNVIIQSLVVLLWVGMAIFLYVYTRVQASKLSYLFWFYGFVILMSIFSLFLNWRQVRYAKRQDQWRQLAAQGNRIEVSLAAEQPAAELAALSLPVILRVKPYYKAIIASMGIIFGIIVVSTVSVLFIFNEKLPHTPHSNSSQTVFIVVCIIFLVVLLVLLGILTRALLSKTHQQFEVTEHELIHQVGKTVNRISWEDAHLFAIPGIAGTKKSGGPPLSYELSSANTIIRWPSLLRGNRGVLFLGDSEIPTEEYNKQMQSVLSFIATKTGLPLYDLRSQKLFS